MDKKLFLPVLLFAGAMMASCSSDEESEPQKASLQVDLSADMSFSTTRSIDESAYSDITNYTVTLKKADGTVVHSALYGDWELLYEIDSNTQYTIEASCGSEAVASYDELLCYGSQTFSAQAGATYVATFQCTPQAAKVSVSFSDDFTDYYSDCDVDVLTRYMTEAWTLNKSTVGEELYIKVDDNEEVTLDFTVKDLDGNELSDKSGTQTVTVSPATNLKITVSPDINEIAGGKFGITVTVDDSVTEKEIDIEIPNTVFNN